MPPGVGPTACITFGSLYPNRLPRNQPARDQPSYLGWPRHLDEIGRLPRD
jgi:hypothetical protein